MRRLWKVSNRAKEFAERIIEGLSDEYGERRIPGDGLCFGVKTE